MKFSKEELQEHSEKMNIANTLCCEVGAIFSCPDHPDIYVNVKFLEVSEVVSLILESDIGEAQEFRDKRELASYIREALDCAELECKECVEIYSTGNPAQC